MQSLDPLICQPNRPVAHSIWFIKLIMNIVIIIIKHPTGINRPNRLFNIAMKVTPAYIEQPNPLNSFFFLAFQYALMKEMTDLDSPRGGRRCCAMTRSANIG